MNTKYKIMIPIFALSCFLCLDSIVYSLTPVEESVTKAIQVSSNASVNLREIYQSLVAVLTGTVLSSGWFLFLLKRMVSQYDAKHDKHDKQILDLFVGAHESEKEISDRLHSQVELLEKELRSDLTSTTQKIIGTLDSLRDTIQKMVTDLAKMQAEHSKCDYKSGDVGLMKTQIENLASSIGKLEKLIDRHLDENN